MRSTQRRFVALAMLTTLVALCGAAERRWQAGVWRETGVTRQMLDFGPGASPFGGPTRAPTMRAMADVRTYVIETDDLRLELKDVVPVGRRSIDITVGGAATFAIEKNTVYVRDPDGKEHRLRLTRKVLKPQP